MGGKGGVQVFLAELDAERTCTRAFCFQPQALRPWSQRMKFQLSFVCHGSCSVVAYCVNVCAETSKPTTIRNRIVSFFIALWFLFQKSGANLYKNPDL